MDREFDLTPEEKNAIGDLERHRLPKAEIENKIIAQLKNEHLIMEKKPRSNYAFIIAASVIIVGIVGYYAFTGGFSP